GRAVSNICSNAGHAALTAAVYMATLGGSGFRSLAGINRDLAEYFKAGLRKRGFKPLSAADTFNEFAMIPPDRFPERRQALLQKRILCGMPLDRYYPEYRNAWLFGVTEVAGKDGIDQVLEELS
ncbi:MAG: glycine dehydrogenase, partial [Planctomycetes bacterium]|nr:glycine dehydrogenase [Planctomycetota bacterium]